MAHSGGPKPPGYKPLDDIIAGAGSGMMAVTASYPFDLLKTRLHFEVGKGNKANVGQVVKAIWSEGYSRGVMGIKPLGGFLGFYRGLDQLLPEAALKALLRFTAFNGVQELYKQYVLNDPHAKLNELHHIGSASVAGTLEAVLIVQPFERGKTLRAAFLSPGTVYMDAFRSGGLSGGFRSVFTGFLPTWGRQVGNQAVSLPLFLKFKEMWLERTGDKDLTNTMRLTFGFLAGCGGACVTMPLDVTKSIMQKQQGENVPGTWQTMKNIVSTRGILGLYAGIGPRLLRVGLDRAVIFLSYEWIIERLRKGREL